MWTFAPDNRIVEHFIRFGTADGEWTGVAGYLEGTFTRPMTRPSGTVLQPTGRKHHLPMPILGHWSEQGTMSEEYLFWDDATLMHQMGVSQQGRLDQGRAGVQAPSHAADRQPVTMSPYHEA